MDIMKLDENGVMDALDYAWAKMGKPDISNISPIKRKKINDFIKGIYRHTPEPQMEWTKVLIGAWLINHSSKKTITDTKGEK